VQQVVLVGARGRPLTAEELDALIRRLDQPGYATQHPATRTAVSWTPSAHVAETLRSQRDAGITPLRIRREFRSLVLESLHGWAGEADFSERLYDLRDARHFELAAAASRLVAPKARPHHTGKARGTESMDVIVTIALGHAENAANSNERPASGVTNITATKLRQYAPLGTPTIITD
jgi:hypothetical protein